MDPWLGPFSDVLKRRYAKAQQWTKAIADSEGGVEKFSRVSCLESILINDPSLKKELLGDGEVWLQRGSSLQHHLSRMGPERHEGVPNWRFQYILELPRPDESKLTCSVDEWNRDSHPMQKNSLGVFEIHLPAKDGQPAIAHNSKVKVWVDNWW